MSKDNLIIQEIHTPLSSIGLFRLFRNEPFLTFLDSGMDRQKLGRYSFLAFDPFLTLRSKGDCVNLVQGDITTELRGRNPFFVLKGLLNEFRIHDEDIKLPFVNGAIGYFSYELRHHLEKLPSDAVDDIDMPDCCLAFYDTVIICDHLKDKTYIASSGFPEKEHGKRRKRRRDRLESVKSRIKDAGAIARDAQPLFKNIDIMSNFTKEDYITAVEKAKEYIAKGDIYQVNLSQRLSCDADIRPYELFERLRAINPAPFSAYLDFKDFHIVSASPERFLQKKGRNIHTRPIKGTRPRGGDFAEDEKLKRELLDSPKDKAEHVMIVDLERNDLGRICEYGTVFPTEFIMLEAYATVFHLVSTVSGVLKEGVDAVDCLTNCFPGGSITGAPKIRSMEIIDELEPTKRAVYTGSIGYLGFNGDMDTSIVIRTFIIKDGKAYFQVGGGIVADSDPRMEYQETLDKAKALVEALTAKTVSLAYSV